MKTNKLLALALAAGLVAGGSVDSSFAAGESNATVAPEDSNAASKGDQNSLPNGVIWLNEGDDFKPQTLVAQYQTIRRASKDMYEGEEKLVQKGAFGEWTIKNGNKVLTKAPLDEIIEYGTKARPVEKKVAEFQTIRRPNKDMLEGEEKVVQAGVNGEWTLINGKWTLTKAPVDKIIEYGTKKSAKAERMEIPYKTIRRTNASMLEGEEKVVQKGVKGYSEKDKNGVWVRKQEPVDEIIEYGTKKKDSTAERMEISFKIIRRANASMYEGEEKVVQKGVKGYSEKDKNGVWVRKQEPVDEIIEYGTKKKDPTPIIERKDIPYNTIRRENKDMYEGEERVIQKGIKGYSEKDKNGVWVRKQEPVDEIIEYGTKKKNPSSTVERKDIPFNTIRRENKDMYEGEEKVVQKGVNGYSEKDKNGVWVRKVEPVDEIIEYGTKKKDPSPTIERKDIPYNTIRRENKDMYEGEEKVVQKGVKGYSEKDKNGVWVRKVEPVDEIIEYGTKKKDLTAERKDIPFNTIRRENKDMYEGEEKVVQKGVKGYSEKDKNGVWVRKQEPVDEIIEYGTKKKVIVPNEPITPPNVPSNPINPIIRSTSAAHSNPKTGIAGISAVASTLTVAVASIIASRNKK